MANVGQSIRFGCLAEPSQPPFGSRADRIAHNEDWCRDLNERKNEWMAKGHLAAGFRCECSRLACGARIRLSGGDWREVRSLATRFAVAPGHNDPDYETVVKEYPHYWIVEKRGEAGKVAEELA